MDEGDNLKKLYRHVSKCLNKQENESILNRYWFGERKEITQQEIG